jgi:predicted LPLAT superfamily acyltransferase
VVKEDISHIYAIGEALNNNELICMHADRFLPGSKTQIVNFLGQPAQFPLGPFQIASAFKVPVCYTFAFKETARHYHFFSTPINRYSHLPKSGQVPAMLHDFVGHMEEKIKLYPEQWFNYYDFWRQPGSTAV